MESESSGESWNVYEGAASSIAAIRPTDIELPPTRQVEIRLTVEESV